MYDPLSESGGFAAPATPWGSPPSSSRSPSPETPKRQPLPPAPNTPDKIPQIYGQPTPGLITPQNSAVNGVRFERPDKYLRVRITALDRNRKDILIRLDAQTNLPNFSGQTYRNISRSYAEFQRFAEQIVYSNPQTIVPALPLAQTSAPTDEEDDRLVKIMLQRWISRICEDPVILNDEEMRSFVESDFGYQPTIRAKRKTSSGLAILRRVVPDEDRELTNARLELTKLEIQFSEAAKAIDKLSKAKKLLSTAYAEMGNKLVSVATAEAHQPLASAIRKFGRTWHTIGDINQAEGIAECVVLGDALGYQGMNARSAKETLLQRTQVLEEFQSAVKNTISKRRNIERLKASSSIRPEKVDEALEELEEATKVEEALSKRVHGMSQNLHAALATHSRHTHEDVMFSLAEHARVSVTYERQLLRELESLRPDVKAITKRPSNGVVYSSMNPGLAGAPRATTPTLRNAPTPEAGPSTPGRRGSFGSVAPSGSQTGPMGGRFQGDGTQSMYGPPSASGTGYASGSSTMGPNAGRRMDTQAPLTGQSRAPALARSLQTESARIDAREAASKLANLF